MRHRELAEALEIGPSGLSRALKGERNFKSMEIALIAEVLGVPVEVLLAEEDTKSHGMRLAARRQPGANAVVEKALDRAETIVSVSALLPADRELQGWQSEVVLDTSATGWRQGLDLGETVRARVRPDEALPVVLSELAGVVESELGIDVALEPLDDGLDGLSVSTEHINLALVSSRTAPTRQRWTLAHEVGHLLAGDSQEPRIDENLFAGKHLDEVRANSFAAAFLVPQQQLRDSVGERKIDEVVVAELLGKYGVSLDALAFRLHNTGLVDAAGRDRVRSYWMTLLSRDSTASERQGTRLPGRLMGRAVAAFDRGELGVRPLAALLGMDTEVLLAELQPDSEMAEALEGEPPF